MYARPRVLPGKIQVFPWVKPGFQGKVPWRIPGNLVFTRIPGKSLVCHGIAEKPGSSPGFSQGESWETAAAARWKSLPFPSLIPGITPGNSLEAWPWRKAGNQGKPRENPGKTPAFSLGKTWETSRITPFWERSGKPQMA